MHLNISPKTVGWLVVAMVLNALLLLPVYTPMLDYGGKAFAQTGPPADTPTAVPVINIDIDIDNELNDEDDSGSGTNPGGGNSGDGSSSETIREIVSENDDNDDDDEPTATFTPLPTFTTTATPGERSLTPTPTPASRNETGSDGDEDREANTNQPAVPILLPRTGSAIDLADLPPLGADGQIYRIPVNVDGVMSLVPLNLGKGYQASLRIQTSTEYDIIVVVNPVDLAPSPLPETIDSLSQFTLDVYLVDSNNRIVAEITSHTPELVFTSDPLAIPTPENRPAMLFRFNEIDQRYERPQQSYDPNTKVMTAYLPATSFFALGVEPVEPTPTEAIVPPASEATEEANIATPTPIIPAATASPMDPEASNGSWWPWLGTLLAGLAGLGGLLYLLSRNRFNPPVSPIPPIAQTDKSSQGLVMAFAPQLNNEAIKVDLVALSQTSSTNTRSSMELNLLSVNLEAVIKPLENGYLQRNQTITIPNHFSLVGWQEQELSSNRLGRNILAGYLEWQGSSDIFALLNTVQLGDIIQLNGTISASYHYLIDDIQIYQGDTISAIDLAQATPTGNQLVVIGWSEAYELEQQKYRDYVVIQAHRDEVVTPQSTVGRNAVPV